MVLTIVLGLLFAAVVFFHYLQGFFSATLSAIFAVLAAVLAFSWHETIVEAFLGGKAANIAHAMVLVALFAVIYLILRTLFDKMVPRGVMMPAVADKIGGGLMGIVAAAFAVGVIAIAAQELPFGSSVAGFTRYASEDREAQIPGTSSAAQRVSGYNYDELHSSEAGTFLESDRQHLFPIIGMGVDEVVVGAVGHLSDIGSLAGSQPLSRIHPDFLQELYGQNIGIQTGAMHVAFNQPSNKIPAIQVDGVFTLRRVFLSDFVLPSVRNAELPGIAAMKIEKVALPLLSKIAAPRSVKFGTLSDDHLMLAVVRVTFGPDSSDADHLTRLSPGSVRLVARKGRNADSASLVDYYPVGMIELGERATILFLTKPDDYIMVPMGVGGRSGIDLAFVVDKQGFARGNPVDKVDEDVFIEVKRMARFDLGGQPIATWSRADSSLKMNALHQTTPDQRSKTNRVDPTIDLPAPVPTTEPVPHE